MKCKRSDTDSYMYYKQDAAGLLVWLLWIDDCASFGKKEALEESRNETTQLFDCENIGNMDENVGCKIGREEGSFTFHAACDVEEFQGRI